MEYLTCGSCKQWRLFGISYPAQLGFILATNSYFCLSISHCLCLYMKNKAFVIYFLFFHFFSLLLFLFFLSFSSYNFSFYLFSLPSLLCFFLYFLSFFFLHFLFFVLLSTNTISSTLTYLYFRRYEKLM